MDLTYTPKQQAFRAEVRSWLAANLPKAPLASYDTREGFEQHRNGSAACSRTACRWSCGPRRWVAAAATSSSG